ncbi:MAG: AtpZ/AtpI family protein [Oscillospiraceae bacterium]|nr:AtpZ/AtpI family protein [Oscillospiraceae bacterium]
MSGSRGITMKDLHLLIWLTQLGLSTVGPLTVCTLIAVWLRQHYGWGSWVIWVGVALGTVMAIDGLRTSLKLMQRLSKRKSDTPPPVSFNEHD